MLKYLSTKSEYDCFGCKACEQICSHNAIEMMPNEEGFYYPELDGDKCINCGLCERVCPVMHPDSIIHNLGCSYVAQNRDKTVLKQSSSGGVFYRIAMSILDNGGVVYGVAFNEEFKTVNIRIDSIENIHLIMGSKYVQSDIQSTYRQVREDLRNGVQVYFSGTPCQIAGLRLFLMKEYENLLTSDLVCHGTPSQKIFSTTISHLEKRYNGKVVGYSFRDKNIRGWSCSSSSSSIKSGEKIKYIKYSKEMEAYFNAFSQGALMRRACYECPFAQSHRTGDITLADFWGVRTKMPDFKNIASGVSLILVNSIKGKIIIESIKDSMVLEEIPLTWAQETNHNLVGPTPENIMRNQTYSMAFNEYDLFLRKYAEKDESEQRIKRQLEYFVRSHPFLFKLVSKISHFVK